MHVFAKEKNKDQMNVIIKASKRNWTLCEKPILL